MVVSSLAPISGARTIWIDPYGRLWHGAPGLDLPHDRWHTVGTFRRPSRDAVTTAVLAVLRGTAAPIPAPAKPHVARPSSASTSVGVHAP